MNRFKNILFISDGLADDTAALMQALTLTNQNKANLNALVIYPEYPSEMTEYQESFEASLSSSLTEKMKSVCFDQRIPFKPYRFKPKPFHPIIRLPPLSKQ